MENKFTYENTKDATHVYFSKHGIQFEKILNGDFYFINEFTDFEWLAGSIEGQTSEPDINLTDQTGRGYPTLEWFLGCGLKLEASRIYVKSLHDNRRDLTTMARDEYYAKKVKSSEIKTETPEEKEALDAIEKKQWPDNNFIDAIGQNGEHYPHESESPLSPNFEAESKLNASTALYAFAGWLTSLKEPITFSENHWATPAADMVAAFIVDNGLSNEKVDFDCMVTPNDSAISKPLSNGDAIEAKPVFTQEMHDRGELPPVGAKVEVKQSINHLGTHATWESGHILECLAHRRCPLTSSPDDVLAVFWNETTEEASTVNVRNIKPIDTRTDEEKLRDAMYHVVSGCVSIESAIEWLMQSSRFTITLNEEG